ncbi:oxidoreductase [Propionibacteriaceae bacterium Y2011]
MTDPLADLTRLEGVGTAVAAAMAAVDTLLRDRGLRQLGDEEVAGSLLSQGRASAALAGVTEGPELLATVRLASELPQLADMLRERPAQALARLHTLWGRGIVPDADLGHPRDDAVAARRLASLLPVLRQPSEAPALVRAAVVEADLICFNAFGRGTGPVARAAAQGLLMAYGVDPRGVVPLAEGHRLLGGYQSRIAAYAVGSGGGVRDWLVHSAQALTRAVEASPVAERLRQD